MTMESANGSRDRTMELLPNLQVVIGECNFYLQVQVIKTASFEMLLGHPFFTLAQESTRHFFLGDSHITLLDPNSAKAVTLPTCLCICSASGFHWLMILLPVEETNLVLQISKTLLRFLPHLQYLSGKDPASCYLQFCSCLCKDLSAKRLKVPLDVRVDKENSLESSFIRSIYLYTILLVCALLSRTFMWPSVTWHVTLSLLMSHSVTYFPTL